MHSANLIRIWDIEQWLRAVGDVMDAKGLVAAAADYSRILDTYGFVRRKITKSQVAVLMYHRISPRRDSWSLKPLNPQCFDRQMRYFSQNYEVLPLDRLVDYIKQGEPLPEKAVVITIDDGYKDNYQYAYPTLRKYRIPATVFLTTGNISTGNLFWWDKVSYIIHHTSLDQLNQIELGTFFLRSEQEKSLARSTIIKKLKSSPGEENDFIINDLVSISNVEIPDDLGEELIMSWDEIREMSNNGIDFGAHTVNHPILTNLPLEQAGHEIVQSKKDIERKIGHHVTAFAYPNGDFNEYIADIVRKSDFSCAVSVLPNKLICPNDSIYGLSRIIMGEEFSKSKVIFSGLWADFKAVV